MSIKINPYKKVLEPGDHVMIHAYKLNGWIYRTWDFPIVIENNDEYILLSIYNCRVISSEENSLRCFSNKINKRSYWYMFKNKFYNLVVSADEYDISGYINISSPFLYEEGAIKYYDFDLDFKLNGNDLTWYEVDIKEYKNNSEKYNYPLELKIIINDVEKKVIQLLENKTLFKLLSKDNIIKLDEKLIQINHAKQSKRF